jgi:membrane protein implicated in regulation of membrane protease activity
MSAEIVWILTGLVLLAAELFFGGFIVVFFAIAAIVTGLAVWAGLPQAGGTPYLLFSVVAVGLLVFLRSRFQSWFTGKSISADQDDDILGHEAVVESGFDGASPTRGRISYRGAGWDARCPAGPLTPGSYVRIVARNGLMLDVEPAATPKEVRP